MTAGSVAVVMTGLVAGTPVAVADPVETPSPAPSYGPITLSPEESQRLCAEVLPKLISRTNKLTTRINGGAEVKGSVAWLKARAASQRAKGNEKVAEKLEKRAERRSSRTGDLSKVKQRLESFQSEHCKVAK